MSIKSPLCYRKKYTVYSTTQTALGRREPIIQWISKNLTLG